MIMDGTTTDSTMDGAGIIRTDIGITAIITGMVRTITWPPTTGTTTWIPTTPIITVIETISDRLWAIPDVRTGLKASV